MAEIDSTLVAALQTFHGAEEAGALSFGAAASYSFLSVADFEAMFPQPELKDYADLTAYENDAKRWMADFSGFIDLYANPVLLSTAQNAFARAFDAWQSALNLRFQIVDPGNASAIKIAFTNTKSGVTMVPRDGGALLDVVFISSQALTSSTAEGSFWFETLVHEIGHAIGLAHPGDAPEFGSYIPQGVNDNYLNTVMSYEAAPDSALLPATPMAYDILAAQQWYGQNLVDKTNNYDASAWRGLRTIWDPLGVDVFDFSGVSTATKTIINLGEGEFSSVEGISRTSIAFGTKIENAIGSSGDDEITGNSLNNDLQGGNGHDIIFGLGGNDTLIGGAGPDELNGGSGNDTYVYADGDGLDTLVDSDGQGSISIDGATLTGGAQYGDALVHRSDDGKHTYVQVDYKTLVIDGKIIVNGYAAGGNALGLSMTGAVENLGSPTIVGDLAPIDQDPGSPGVQIRRDDLGNIVTDPNAPEVGRADELYGSPGNDIIAGGSGGDILNGTAGDDRLYSDALIDNVTAIVLGRTQNGSGMKGDWLAGGAGADTLIGGAGNDVLAGGAGKDLLIAGAGDDDILGDADYVASSFDWTVTDQGGVRLFSPTTGGLTDPPGSAEDVIYAGAGNDYVWAGSGNDVVFGDEGNDRLSGVAGNDVLMGGGGNDTIWGGENNDYLDGGTGSDVIDGEEADDVLIGGAGNDTLYGGSGQDTYIFNVGDGNDTVYDSKAENNIFRFGDGVNEKNIKLRLGSLLLDIGNGDALHIGNFDQHDVFNSSSIGAFAFADGTVLNATELLARGFDLDGTSAADTIEGTNTTDRISGFGGDDILDGGDGDDVLSGGAGRDELLGGLGNDVYLFNIGDGGLASERIADTGGVSTLRFGDGISLASIKTSNINFKDLYIEIGAERIWAERSQFTGLVDIFEFADGVTLTLGQLVAQTWQGATVMLQSAADNETFIGRSGGDGFITLGDGAVIDGGGGNDSICARGIGNTIIHSKGGGVDYFETGDPYSNIFYNDLSNNNALRLKGLTPDELSLKRRTSEQISIQIGENVNDAVVVNWDPNNPLLSHSFDRIEFDSGEVLSYRDLLNKEVEWIASTPSGTQGWVMDGSLLTEKIVGSYANDRIDGKEGNDRLYGQGGNDTLIGEAGDDTLDGGAGNDSLIGGIGNDTYWFGRYDGIDTISELDTTPGNLDTLRIKDGLGPRDVLVTRPLTDGAYNDLLLFVAGTSHSIRIKNWFLADGSNRVEQVIFADGTIWDSARLQAAPLSNPLDDQAITGGAGNDFLVGGVGNDTLNGGGGDDVYVFNRGDGADAIYNYKNSPYEQDVIRFGAGISTDEVEVTYAFGNVMLTLPDWGGWISVSSDLSFLPDVAFADGTVWDAYVLLTKLSDAASDTSPLFVGTRVNDVIDGAAGYANSLFGMDGNDRLTGGVATDQLVGGNGNDTLIGGEGSDTLDGGAGRDTYVFRRGDGSDYVDTVDPYNPDTRGYRTEGTFDTDVIRFGAGIAATEVTLSQSNGSFRLAILGTNDSISFGTDLNYLPQVEFANGTVWDRSTMLAMLAKTTGNLSSELLIGTSSSDVIDGRGGWDEVFGMAGDDWLKVREGNLFGGEGNDTLLGGTVGFLMGGEGNDIYEISAGADLIIDQSDSNAGDNDIVRFNLGISASEMSVSFWQGALWLQQWTGSVYVHLELIDWLYQESDTARITTFEFADGTIWGKDELLLAAADLVGTTGNDDLYGLGWSQGAVSGLGGDDRIHDYVDEEARSYLGDVTMDGGEGNDTYLVGSVGGEVRIFDSGGDDRLVLQGLDLSDIALGTGSLRLTVKATGREIHLDDFDRQNPYAAGGIESFEFADGQVLSKTQLIDALGFHIAGTSTADTLLGTALGDVIDGGAGGDIIRGEAGDDLIAGGLGADRLDGGSGNDRYLFALGDGHDRIVDDSGPDRLIFGNGISAQQVNARYDNGDLVLTVSAFDSIRLVCGANGLTPVEQIEFANGDVWQTSDLIQSLFSSAPVATGTLANQLVARGELFQLTLPTNLFADSDVPAGDVVTVSAKLASGAVLPAWLTFDAATQTFTGTPASGDVGNLSIILTAVDLGGASVSLPFGLTVLSPNLTPTGTVSITGSAVQKQILTASNTLADGDGMGVVRYQWQSSLDGTTWSAIAGAINSTLTLTEPLVNTLIRVVASFTDGGGTAESVASGATVPVVNVNDAPVLVSALSTQATTEGTPFAVTLPAGAFTDPDAGDSLSYSAKLSSGAALPAWVSFNTATRSFSGTAGANDLGNLQLVVTARDAAGLSATGSFTLAVTAHAPVSLVGTAGNDSLTGFSGADTLNGGLGADTMAGGKGNDTYVVDDLADVVIENASEGTDLVQSSVGYVLAANVENLTLTGTLAIDGTGNALANAISGNSGNNVLNGGAGADTLAGGLGDDTYVVDLATDMVTENLNEGIDTVQASLTYTLSANLDNLTLTGTTAINGTGNSLDNVLRGNSAANALAGGTGNDTYYVSTGDTVTEAASAGTDTVNAAITWTLGANLENLILAGTAAINGTGNTANNVITGNAANNVLSGGTGADTLLGGVGNDTYVVDNIGDIVSESVGEGTDLVQAGVTYTLSANLENLTLTGTAAINGTGNALDNVLTGNTAVNTLTGGAGNDRLDGGTGADKLLGGTGNDTYVVDVTTDVVTENLNEGIDTVESKVTLTLAANVENLTLTGTTAINGTGNTLDNVLIGNSAINTLTGGTGNDTLDGKAGADKLLGGAGNDIYYVDIATDAITENVNEGTDTVIGTVAWTLGTNLENLTLAGSSAINGTGNTVNNVLVGNSAINTLSGAAGNDTLDGAGGNDSLVGGVGNDTYQFGRGYGADAVSENDATVGNTDLAQFSAGIATDQLWFRHVGNNLEASIIGTTDSLTLQNWYLGSAYHVEQFKTADGKALLDSRVDALVQAMAAFAPPTAGQTSLPPAYQTALAPVLAANWQ